MLKNAVKNDDIDLAYESFFQVERRIKECNLFNKSDYIKFLYFSFDFKNPINNLVNVDFEPDGQNNSEIYVL